VLKTKIVNKDVIITRRIIPWLFAIIEAKL